MCIRDSSYIRLAQGTGINAFVVDIVDGTAVSYASPVMQQYSPSAYAAAQDTMEGFKANVQKLRDAGYYVIGRITVFLSLIHILSAPRRCSPRSGWPRPDRRSPRR